MANLRYHRFWVYLRGPPRHYLPGSQALAIPIPARRAGALRAVPPASPGFLPPPSRPGLRNRAGRGAASRTSASRWLINVLLMSKLAFTSGTPSRFPLHFWRLKSKIQPLTLNSIGYWPPLALLLREFLWRQPWLSPDSHEMHKLHASRILKTHMWKCRKALKTPFERTITIGSNASHMQSELDSENCSVSKV